MTAPLLELRRAGRSYRTGPFSPRTVAVQDVSFVLEAGRPEVFAIIGESGSGKSTLARMILNTLAPTEGAVCFRGRDLATIRRRRDRLAFMAEVQPIFQNPFEAFNPLRKVDRYLAATARRFAGARRAPDVARTMDEALQRVGLSLAEIGGRYPHELSGGQLQRVAVARALIPRPALLVADEPVSMIDASLRMTVVNLFKSLRDELGVSIIYITHDLATAYYVSDRVMILQRSRVVEAGDARAVLSAPQHPYSIALRNAVLSPEDAWADRS